MDERDAAIISIYAGHCLVKCANVVLASRVLDSPRKKAEDRAKNWFSLELDEVAPAAADLAKWRTEAQQPLMLKILLRTTNDTGPSEPNTPGCDEDVLLEQWCLAYDGCVSSSRSSEGSIVSDRLNEGRMDKHSVYKKMIILTRSLYTYLRIMPAYRLFRAGQNAQSRSFDIVYQILSGEQAAGEKVPDDFNQFSFSKLHTPTGAVSIHVSFRPASMIDVLEETTHAQSLPRIITNYINSPRQLLSLSESIQKAPMVASTVSNTPIHENKGQQVNQQPLLYPHCWSSKELLTYPQPLSHHIAIPSQSGGSSKPNIPHGSRPVSYDTNRSYPKSNSRSQVHGGDTPTLRSRSSNPDEPNSELLDTRNTSMDTSGAVLIEEKSSTQATESACAKNMAARTNAPRLCNEAHYTYGAQVTSSGNAVSEEVDIRPLINSSEKNKYFTAEGVCLSTQRSDSSYTSISSSQLPFACTPPGLVNALESSSFGMSMCDPSPPISGRDISALAIIRRPSWSSRSFDMNIPKLSDPLDPWLTPHSQAASTLIPVSKPSLGIQDSSLSRMIELEKKQKSQVAAMQQSEKLHNFFVGSSESDSLPFAIDGESGNGQDVPCDDGCGLGSYGAVVNSEGSSYQSDAAVASFLRLMQDAPPLTSPRTSPALSFERAREQLREFKVKVEGFKLDM